MFSDTDKNTVYECTGTVESVVYRNDENGYTVIELSGEESITAVGIMPLLSVGEEVKLTGVFKNHPAYGPQFSVTACERSIPKNVSGILKYLSSGAIKGIGPATAQKLVNEFKENTIEVLENEPERVAKIKGITMEKAYDISRQIRMNSGIRELLVYFAGYDISPNCALNVYRAMGGEAIERIKENPYILCNGDFGISFEKADKIAMAQDKPADSEYRLRAGLAYVLVHNQLNGHTCLPKETLIKVTADFLGVDIKLCADTLEEMIIDSSFVLDEIGDKSFVFVPSVHRCEKFISARINFICRYPADRIPDIDKRIKHIEKTENIKPEEFVSEMVELPIEEVKEDIDLYEESLKDLENNTIRDGSKLLEVANRLSLLAMVAYSYKNDVDLDDWLEEYAANNNTYFMDQRKNYSHMINDFRQYQKRIAIA